MCAAEVLGIGLGKVDVGVCPVDEVLRTQHHDARILAPTVLYGEHVGGYHVERPAVLAAQNVRVAYAAALGYGVGGDYGAVAVQRRPVHGVGAQSKTQLLLLFGLAAALEVGEQITRILGLVGRDGTIGAAA